MRSAKSTSTMQRPDPSLHGAIPLASFAALCARPSLVTGPLHHRRSTHRARRPLLSTQHRANSRARDASSTPALPSRAWRVAPMLLGTDGCVCDGSASTKIVSSIYLRTVICPRATALLWETPQPAAITTAGKRARGRQHIACSPGRLQMAVKCPSSQCCLISSASRAGHPNR
jgi:hypothetical protein